MTEAADRPGPRVSLLMPNRNNAAVLDMVLESLARNTTYEPVELVVVDDGSTDESPELLRRWRDSGRFREFQLHEREHAGVVETLNHGLRSATGDVVVQLDADASVETPDWVQRMLALLELDDRVGVVTARVVIDTGVIHACGVSIVGPEGLHDRGTAITEPVGRRRLHSRMRRPPEGQSDACAAPAEVDAGIGCCMMYRRADALAAGGYDRGFGPVWFDDLDLCMSIRRLGKKVFYLPDVRVLHRLSHRQPPPGRARRMLRSLPERLPQRTQERIVRTLRTDRPPPAVQARLEHHYAYWREKWGWDLLNPDMEEVLRLHGGTEVCWAYEPDLRAAGEAILARFRSAL